MIPVIILTLSCCARKSTDTYFLHAIYLDKNDDNYTIYALSEKNGQKDAGYKVISRSGENPDDAASNLKNTYRDCYFATTEIYFLSEDSPKIISEIAKGISTSNTFPSKSNVILIEGNVPDFMKAIKNENTFKHILRLCEDGKVNAIKLFSHFLSGKSTLVPTLSIDENKEIKLVGLTEFSPNKE